MTLVSMASAPSQEVTGSSADLEGLWGSLGAPPAPLLLPHFAHRALPCFGWLHPPPLGLVARQTSARCQLRPLPWPCASSLLPSPCGPSLLLLRPEEGGPLCVPRGKGGPSRESTAALKAWLGRHPRNPYPSKGEKVLLALVSRMSLTQVSTWFANARRRLKKENRACWGGRAPREGEGEGEQEEEDEEEEAESGGEAEPQGSPPSRPKTPQGLAPRLEAEQASTPPSPIPTEPLPPRPKIWRLAEFATGPQTQRPVA